MTGGRLAWLDVILVAVLMLLGVAQAARAEDSAALMARAPALALDQRVTPLVAPVEVATVGWGPFTRLCVRRTAIGQSAPADVLAVAPNCFTVDTAREDGGTWHLAIRTEARGGRPSISFATTRDARGQVGPATITVPAGMRDPSPEERAMVEAVFRTVIEANGMSRATIAPDAPFILPVALGGITPNLRAQDGGFTCRIEGQTRIRDRQAVVAACAGRATGSLGGGRAIVIDTAGRFVIDVATGMVVRHGYASVVVLEANAATGEARDEMRGASTYSLE